jgi:lysophospholipase L1-like esterase
VITRPVPGPDTRAGFRSCRSRPVLSAWPGSTRRGCDGAATSYNVPRRRVTGQPPHCLACGGAGEADTSLASCRTHRIRSLVVAADGSVWAWGNNGAGQLGTGTTSSSSQPVAVTGLGAGSGVVAVASSAQKPYGMALKADGTVLAWGDNSQGELGTGDNVSHLTPTPVLGLGPGSGVIAIAAGVESLALKADGTVLTWGGNAGLTTPTEVPGLGPGSGVIAISSYGTSMALKSDGSVLAWGLNSFGQLGDGTTQASDTPVNVSGLGPGSGVVAIAAGELHSMALESDGTVLAWGDGGSGELGTGNTDGSLVPIQVPGLGAGSGVVSIAAGGGDSFAITQSGSVFAWGNNAYGELGDGTDTAFVYSPEVVGALATPSAAGIAVGYYHTLVAPVAGGVVPPPQGRYVALGDSVPYGHGLANPRTVSHDGLPPSQPPSDEAWPSLVAHALGYQMTIRPVYCVLSGDQLTVSGAPMFSIDSGAWTDCSTTATHPAVFPDEVDAANISADPPALVTIQAGADDINFGGCLEYVLGFPGVAGGTKCTSKGRVTSHVATLLTNVTTGLVDTLREISQESKGTAKVLVVNYYLPVPTRADFVSDGSQLCVALKAHNLSNGVYHQAVVIQSALNAALQAGVTRAQKLGYSARMANIADVFGGLGSPSHGMCTAQPWVFTGSSRDAIFWRAVHPNGLGQAAIANAVENQIRKLWG